MKVSTLAAVAALSLIPVSGAMAQDDETPSDLKIYFDLGSSQIRADQGEALDTAARLFRDGNPIVMIVSGSADTVGGDLLNLNLSTQRAQTVAVALADRGIPASRLQITGLGNSELAVETPDGTAEQQNRTATITWR